MVVEGTVLSITCMELNRQIQINIVKAGRPEPSGATQPLSLDKTYHVQAPKSTSHGSVSQGNALLKPLASRAASSVTQGRQAGHGLADLAMD